MSGAIRLRLLTASPVLLRDLLSSYIASVPAVCCGPIYFALKAAMHNLFTCYLFCLEVRSKCGVCCHTHRFRTSTRRWALMMKLRNSVDSWMSHAMLSARFTLWFLVAFFSTLLLQFDSNCLSDRHTMTRSCDSDIEDMFIDIAQGHIRLGELTAELNWLLCMDIDGKLNSTKAIFEQIKFGRSTINRKISLLDNVCSEFQLNAFKAFAHDLMNDRIETCEQQKELIHRPHGLQFDSKAVINLTNVVIPLDILVGLSFGHKFMYPFNFNSRNKEKFLALLECTIDKAVSPVLQDMAAKELYITLKKHDTSVQCPTNKWLNFIKLRTDRFFSNNNNLAAIRSDKGNHTVVIHTDDYKNKILHHLNDPAYKKLCENPLAKLIATETRLIATLNQKPDTKRLVRAFQPNTLSLPIFYGVIKIHKDYKIRPITSTSGAVGSITSKALQTMIAQLFPRREHNIKGSFDFKQKIDAVSLQDNDVMVSMDIVSMYTSIPIELVIELIMSRSAIYSH